MGGDGGLCLPLSCPFDDRLPYQETLRKHPPLKKGGQVSRSLLYLREKTRAGDPSLRARLVVSAKGSRMRGRAGERSATETAISRSRKLRVPSFIDR